MRKLTKRSQMFIYAIAGMGVNTLNLMMGSYLCSALLIGGFKDTEVLPFQTFLQRDLVDNSKLIFLGITVWGLLGLIAKIVDGIIDIPMASFTDNLRTKWGRRRPSILIGLVGTIATYLLFLVVPNPSGVTALNTVYYFVVLCLFYTSYTLTMVSYYATFTEIVDSEADRSFIANVKSVCDIFYFILGFVLVPIMLGKNALRMNIRLVALIVLPIVLTMLIPLFMIKENKDELGNVEKVKSVSLVQSIGHTFRNKTFIIWMCVYAVMTFGLQLFLSGINEYFTSVRLNQTFVMASSFALVPLTLVLYNFIVKKKGFAFAFRYVLIMFGLGMLSMFFTGLYAPESLKLPFAIASGTLCSFAVGSLFAVAYSVPAQLAAEEEARTGISNSAMYFAVQGLFSGVASGIGGSVVLNALKGKEEEASGNIVYMTLICAIAMAVAFAGTFLLPKSLAKMGKKDNK